MKRLLWLPALAFSLALAACSGGGGSSVTVPPPTGGFTLASLKGNYAFSMSGMDPTTGAYFTRTGSFAADGAGNISGGIEDDVDLGATTPVSQATFTGKYTMLASGRGTLALTYSTGNLTWTMDLQSTSQGLLVETDGAFASSGSFNQQNISDFLATSFSGNYVFDFSGITLTGTTVTNISIIGNIAANGSGLAITSGVLDSNDGNNGPSGPVSLSTQGAFEMDPTYGPTNGRGIATFAGYSYAFYIVDNTRIKFIEEDANGGSSGDAVLQSGTIPTTTAAFTGSFVYLTGGDSLSTMGADASVARFTIIGSGTIGAIAYDENNAGTNNGDIHITQGTNISNANYAIDTTYPGSGRGTFTFTDSTHGTFSYVFYLVSPTSGVIQDVSTNIIADGTLLGQSGSPFTLAGNYAYNWNGVNNISFNEEDFIGLFTLASTSTNNITGVLDGTVIGARAGNSYPDNGTKGTLTITSDGTASNPFIIVAGSPLSTTFTSVAYIVDANTVLILDTDTNQVLAGIAYQQVQ